MGFRDWLTKMAILSPYSKDFQYSLRIVGFRDGGPAGNRTPMSAFQYSLRIVGFRDGKEV